MPAAIRFGSAGTLSNIARTTNLPPITNFTVMAWMRMTATTATYTTLFSLGASGSTQYYAMNFSSDGLSLRLWNYVNSWTYGVITVGRWYHLAMALTPTTFLGYVNGSLALTGALNASIVAQAMRFGSSFSSGLFNGRLAAIKVWNRGLAAGEIQAEMFSALPVNYSGLNSCYPIATPRDILPMNEEGYTSARTRWADWSGNGLEFTETGTITTELGPPIG